MVFNRYTYYILLRAVLLGITIAASVYFFEAEQLYVAAIFLAFLSLFQIYLLARFAETSNRELKRFVDAVRHSDFSQSFSQKKLGSSFGDLSAVFSDVISDFKKERIKKEEQFQYLQTIVKHINVGLISYYEDGTVDLMNDAARELLEVNSLKNIGQLKAKSEGLVEVFQKLKEGGKQLVNLETVNGQKQIAMSSSRFTLRGRQYVLVSLQDIGGELEHERMAKELEIAHQVQMELLPQRFPAIEGYDIAGFCLPAKEVGGDYFDFAPVGNNKTGITVGDVSGKGSPAAMYMTLIKGSFQAYAPDSDDPNDVLSKINGIMHTSSEPGMFVTMLYGILDPYENSFSFSRAGHNPLFRFSAGSGKAEWYKPKGLGLGIADSGTFERLSVSKKISLFQGDILLLYTDGLNESMNAADELFGYERIERIITEAKNEDAGTIAETLRKGIYDFCGGEDFHDDITLLVVKKIITHKPEKADS